MTTNDIILRDIIDTAHAHNQPASDVLLDMSDLIDNAATRAMRATLRLHFDYISDDLLDELIADLTE